MLVKVVNKLVEFIPYLLNIVLKVLPDSPFKALQELACSNEILGYANYFLPISEIIATCESWLLSIIIYYCYMVIGRWAKVID